MERAVALDFSKQPERPNQLETNLNGPGTYEVYENFGQNMNKITIGIRRDENTLLSPGPGTYSPEKADQLILAKAAAADFSKQTERLNSVEGNLNGPGQY